MTPVTFEGCAGWLDVGSGGTGIVVCAPLGREGMLAYRGCRILANDLHAHGFSVLRFDYPGTGDSSGDEADPDRLPAWRYSIVAAIALLRRATSCTEVILIGFRLGAAFALEAAASDPSITAVCCLAPVMSGRSYVREMRLLAAGWREANLLPALSPASNHLDVAGDRFALDTLRALSSIDLCKIERTASHVLLMDSTSTTSADRLAAQLRSLGASVTRADFSGATAFLQDPFAAGLPQQAFRTVTSWCVGLPTRTSVLAPPQVPSGPLRLPGAVEEGAFFGPAGKLYGVLCLPTREGNVQATVVLIPNTGFGRRTGDGRIFVTLARQLADLGIGSFRIDVRGCGESDGPRDRVAEPYAPEIVDDVVEAANLLCHRGFDRLVLVGICSGAHAAFHAGLRDKRVAGMILVNLQTFIWQSGTPLLVQNSRQRRPAGFYLRSAIRREAWSRLIRGRIAVGAIVTALVRRLAVAMRAKVCLLLERHVGTRTRAGQVRRWLAELDSRGMQIDLLYSDGDPGLAELAVVVGSRRRTFPDLPHVRVDVVPGADHALLDHDARHRVIDRVCHLVQALGPAS